MPSTKKAVTVKATSNIPYTLFYGTFVDTPELGQIRISFNTLVGVNKDGEMDFIERDYNAADHNGMSPVQFFIKAHGKQVGAKNNYEDYYRHRYQHNFEYVDYSEDVTKFFFPGFVDTHIHASQFANIGIGLDMPLLDWLHEYTFPMENRFTDGSEKLQLAHQIYSKVIRKTLANGTTCALYFTTTDADTTNLFGELLLMHGQRGFVGKVCMDHNATYHDYEEDYETCIDSMTRLVDYIAEINPDGETLVKPIVTPRFAPVCSRELMGFLGGLANKHRIPIQTHISENLKEIELVKELFPECASYADVYDQHKLLTPGTILAHGIHLTEDERELVKERGCSISHCPTSNTFISSGEAPVKKYMYEDGINVSLGTDVSGGFDSSILGVLRSSILVSHHLSMKEIHDDAAAEKHKLRILDALYMATMGGARAVGLGDTISTFDVGKRFDVQLIDLESTGLNVDIFEWQRGEDVRSATDRLGKWVFSGDDRNCVKVWCNGRMVVNKTGRDDRWIMVDKKTEEN